MIQHRHRRSNGTFWVVLGMLIVGIIVLGLCCWPIGCASDMRLVAPPGAGVGVTSPAPVPPPTSQPIANVATQGQIAASIVSQLRADFAADLSAEISGIKMNRTVDHALDVGQVIVLLAAIWLVRAVNRTLQEQSRQSHERALARIENDAKARR